jgi:hypothetical protein
MKRARKTLARPRGDQGTSCVNTSKSAIIRTRYRIVSGNHLLSDIARATTGSVRATRPLINHRIFNYVVRPKRPFDCLRTAHVGNLDDWGGLSVDPAWQLCQTAIVALLSKTRVEEVEADRMRATIGLTSRCAASRLLRNRDSFGWCSDLFAAVLFSLAPFRSQWLFQP